MATNMDAVKAVSMIDESESVAQQADDTLEVDFSHPDVQAINMIAHMDGALSEDVVETADIDDESADMYLKMSKKSLWEDVDFDSDDISTEELVQAAENKKFDDEETQVILEMEDRMKESMDEASFLEAELVKGRDSQVGTEEDLVTVSVAAAAAAVVVVVVTAIDITP
jgi:hypothetical protein